MIADVCQQANDGPVRCDGLGMTLAGQSNRLWHRLLETYRQCLQQRVEKPLQLDDAISPARDVGCECERSFHRTADTRSVDAVPILCFEPDRHGIGGRQGELLEANHGLTKKLLLWVL